MRKLLEKLFKPRAIAVIGATERQAGAGYFLMKNLLNGSYQGQVLPVNPKHRRVWGETCYSSILKVPVTVDLAIICTPAYAVVKVLKECGEAGVGSVMIATSSGPDDDIRREVAAVSRQFQIRILGPESLGFMNNNEGINATVSNQTAQAGHLAFITQSGSLGVSVLDWAIEHRIGFSHFVALGETIDVGFDDLIDYLGADTHTSCILIFLEKLDKARRFMSAARAFARSKPIIVLKAGRSPSDAAFGAAFRRAGLIRVDTVAQLFNCAHSLAMQHRPTGNRLAIITNADGPGTLAADYLLTNNGQLATFSSETEEKLKSMGVTPANPVNLYGLDTPEQYQQALKYCLEDAQADGVVAILTPMSNTQPEAVAQAFVLAAQHAHKPVLASWMGERQVGSGRRALEAGRIPQYRFPESAVDTFLKMYRHHRNLQLLQEAPPAIPVEYTPGRETAMQLIQKARGEGRSQLTDNESLQLLACYHISVDHTIADPDFQLLIGSYKDPTLGPMIRFGRGGAGAHIDRDWQLGLPPLNVPLARRVIENTRIYPLLTGLGGLPGVDLRFLEETLCKFSYLIMDFPEIQRLEINPFVVKGNQGAAGKTVVELEPPEFKRSPRPYDHLVISPYPAHYQRNARLKNGEEVLLRPIRPEDETLESRMFDELSRETLYFRFFGYVPKLTHEFLVRFTQIDYDREMAIVAELDVNGDKKMIGVVRVIADAWKENAEYAIVVADAWHGQGLGSLLTDYIIEIARDMGMKKITANVLSTNKSMLRLFERKGFAVKREDFEVYYAELPL